MTGSSFIILDSGVIELPLIDADRFQQRHKRPHSTGIGSSTVPQVMTSSP